MKQKIYLNNKENQMKVNSNKCYLIINRNDQIEIEQDDETIKIKSCKKSRWNKD